MKPLGQHCLVGLAVLGLTIAAGAMPGAARQPRPATEITVDVNALTDATGTGRCAAPPKGSCGLRQALTYVAGLGVGYPAHATINVTPGTYDLVTGDGLETLLAYGNVTLQKWPGASGSVVIEPDPANPTTFGILYTGIDSTVVLKNLTIQNGSAHTWGGGIYSEGTTTELSNCIVRDSAALYGGGIYHERGAMRLIHTRLIHNFANDGGGGIYDVGASLVVDRGSAITQNTAATGGGGLEGAGGSVRVVNSTISLNTTAGYGGGIFYHPATDTSPLVVTGTSAMVSGNAAYGGAGISNLAGHVEVVHGASVTHNLASTSGGGIQNIQGTLDVNSRASITGNASQPGFGGGGIYVVGGYVNLVSAVIAQNIATEGAGIHNEGGTVQMTDTSVFGNHTSRQPHGEPLGGGIYTNGGFANIDHSVFYSNRAGSGGSSAGRGGAIYLSSDGVVSISDSTITKNKAIPAGLSPGLGGGIYADGGSLSLTFDTIASNSALGGGSGGNIFFATTFLGADTPVVADSIVAYGRPDNCNGPLTPGSGNLVYDGSGSDSCNVAAVFADPTLDSLADNGGDTLTMALMPGSPAAGLVSGSDCIVVVDDQRHDVRGTSCDAGAVQ